MADRDALILQMSADIRRMEQQLSRARTVANDNANAIQGRFDRLNRASSRSFDDMARNAGAAMGRISAGAGLALGAVIGFSVRAAAAAAETRNAFEVAFGGQTQAAQQFAQTYSREVGRALTTTQQHMAQVQLVLTGVGQTAETALRNTQAVTERAVDLGSLWNVDDAEAFRAILSGISGEAEPMKRFGVVLNQAALEAELLRMGIRGGAQAATEAQKAQARLNIILARTASAQGDATRTAGSLANQTRAMQARFQEAAEQLGNNFLPTATQVVTWANNALTAFNNLPSGVQVASIAMLGLAAAGGPIAALIGGLRGVVTWAVAARAAIAGLGASGAAGAATGAGIGALGLGAAVGGPAGLIIGGATFAGYAPNMWNFQSVRRNPQAANDEQLANALGIARGLNANATRDGANPTVRRERAADLAALEAEANRRSQAQAQSAGARAFAQWSNQFWAGVANAQQGAPAAGGSAGSGRGGRAAGAGGGISLTMPDFMEADPSSRVDLNQMILGGIRDVMEDLPDLVTPEDFTEPFARAQAEIREEWRGTIRGGLDAAIRDGWDGLARYMAERLQAHLADRLTDAILDIVMNVRGSGGGSGAGNIFASILSIFTGGKGGGKFAHGTGFAKGGLSLVGEHGPELVALPTGSKVFSNPSLRSMGGGGVTIMVDAKGAILTDEFVARIEAMGQRAQIGGAALALGAARKVIPAEMAQRARRRFA